MTLNHKQNRSLAACAALAFIFAGTVSAAANSYAPAFFAGDEAATINPVDARDYRHCHHMARRAYCHVSDNLPRNWPPHSDRSPSPQDKHSHSEASKNHLQTKIPYPR
ncbi:hypothetical protein RLW55_17885 [Hyphomicrobium sp. B1]|jgi:hypothetical protein|uniref:hypothetical protein n=1 Tax=unclassified Hyphomicrobium TaxID=2619925 RepID=UPI00391C72AE